MFGRARGLVVDLLDRPLTAQAPFVVIEQQAEPSTCGPHRYPGISTSCCPSRLSRESAGLSGENRDAAFAPRFTAK